MSDENVRPPGLREETLREAHRVKKIMQHEVRPIIEELLYLRSLHNASANGKTLAEAMSTVERAFHLRQSAKAIDRSIKWSLTPQGQDYWDDVTDYLVELAEEIETNPEAYK
jgi:hypothetical protein